jgi:hypothetical protein
MVAGAGLSSHCLDSGGSGQVLMIPHLVSGFKEQQG